MKHLLAAIGLLALTCLWPSRADAAIVTLTWDGVPEAAGYIVHYGTSSGRYSATVDVGPRTSHRFTSLPSNATYFFAVTSYDEVRVQSFFSTEVSTHVESSPETAVTVDLTVAAAPTSLDAAFDPVTRRYLLTYVTGGRVWISILDVWGAPIGEPIPLTAGAGSADARVAAGGGRFLVLYTDTVGGNRMGRFVQPGAEAVAVSPAHLLGPATEAAGNSDNAGGGVTFMPDDDRFLGTWEHAGDVFARVVSTAGPSAPAANLTGDAGLEGCRYGRPEVAWDSALQRAIVLGSREGAGCAAGGAVWMRIVGSDGSSLAPASDLRIISAAAGPQSYRRVAYSNLENRFLLLWSEKQTTDTDLIYRIGDATGGLSGIQVMPNAGALTPEPEDDSFLESAVAYDADGTFAFISRVNPPAGGTAGQLYFHRVDTSGHPLGKLHPLPAAGLRTLAVLTPNPVTRQLLAAYVDATGHVRAMTIGARLPTTITLTASRTTISAGEPVSVSAQGAGGAAPYEFKFWRFNVARSEWTSLQPYGSAQAATWTSSPGDIGRHIVQVWARSSGSASDYEAWQNVDIEVRAAAPLSVTLNSDRGITTPVGTTVTWSAGRTGGTGSIEYQFWVYNANAGTWTVARPYAPSSTFAWTPAAAGQYGVQVWARATGSSAGFEAWAGSDRVTVVAPARPSIRSFAPDRITAVPGIRVTWQTRASGGSGPLQYQFWRYNVEAQTWAVVQPFGPSPSYSWTPGATDAGSYVVQVWVKDALSTSDSDVWQSSSMVTVTNVVLKTLTVNVAMPAPVGSPITWRATATAAAGTVEYQFWVYSAATGTWQIGQGYSVSPTYTWTPSEAGEYTVQLWARAVGSASLEVWRNYGPFTIRAR